MAGLTVAQSAQEAACGNAFILCYLQTLPENRQRGSCTCSGRPVTTKLWQTETVNAGVDIIPGGTRKRME